MIKPEDHELKKKDDELLYSYYMPQIRFFRESAREHALQTCKALTSLNAGATIIYPTIFELFETSLSASDILWPTLISLFGCAAAVLSSFFAYLNFESHAMSWDHELHSKIILTEHYYDDALHHTHLGSRQKNYKFHGDRKEKSDTHVEMFYWLALISGASAGMAFLSSAALFAHNIIY